MSFNLERGVIFIDGFPAKAGFTLCLAGDFGYSNPNNEMIQSNMLKNKLGATDYHKIIPDHEDQIVLAKNCGSYRHCDAIVSYKEKGGSEVLCSITADCPTIVMTAREQKLIAIIHSGWRSTKLNIATKTIALIKKEHGIEPQEISVGILRGICGECYTVGKEVGENFPLAFRGGKLNLRQVIISQLIEAGINEKSNIYLSGLAHCSYHSLDDFNQPILFSYRRDKTKERNAVFITRR
jgi:copper oxidase (laccase) domain-containing protein